MDPRPRTRRFWGQAVASAAALVLLVVTLVSREWVELVFGVDPDHGNGEVEWLLVAVLGLVALGFGVAASREWRRGRQAAPER